MNLKTLEETKPTYRLKEVDKAYDSRTVHAVAVVVNYTISDAFDLSAEESIWVGWHLQSILEPLQEETPEGVQAAVRQELETFNYSNALFDRDKETGNLREQVRNVKYASLDEWTEAISEIIFASYPDLRPLAHSRIIGGISGLLCELGITNNKDSRASLYLPNALRYIIASR